MGERITRDALGRQADRGRQDLQGRRLGAGGRGGEDGGRRADLGRRRALPARAEDDRSATHASTVPELIGVDADAAEWLQATRDARELALARLHDDGRAAAITSALSATTSPSTLSPRCAMRRSASDVDSTTPACFASCAIGIGVPPVCSVTSGIVSGSAPSRKRASNSASAASASRARMEARDDLLRQHHLGVARIAAFGAFALQRGDLVHRAERQQLVVAPHQRRRRSTSACRTSRRRLGDADVVVLRLRHLLDAVEALEQRHRQDALRLLAVVASAARGRPAG